MLEKVLLLFKVIIFGLIIANAVDLKNNSLVEHPVVIESLTETDPFPSHHSLQDFSIHNPNIAPGRSIATVCDSSNMLIQSSR